MAERVRLNRSLLSSSYTPSAATEVGILEQQAVGQSQITKLLNTMSGFFYDQMAEKVVEEGEMYGATNPITMEELEKASQTGEDPTKRLGYGTRGIAARSTAFQSVMAEIELQATRDYAQFISLAKTQELDPQEVADGLDAISLGYADILKNVSPTDHIKLKGKLSQTTGGYFKGYMSDFIDAETKKQQGLAAVILSNIQSNIPTKIDNILLDPTKTQSQIESDLASLRTNTIIESQTVAITRGEYSAPQITKLTETVNKDFMNHYESKIISYTLQAGLAREYSKSIIKNKTTGNPRIDALLKMFTDEDKIKLVSNLRSARRDELQLEEDENDIDKIENETAMNNALANMKIAIDKNDPKLYDDNLKRATSLDSSDTRLIDIKQDRERFMGVRRKSDAQTLRRLKRQLNDGSLTIRTIDDNRFLLSTEDIEQLEKDLNTYEKSNIELELLNTEQLFGIIEQENIDVDHPNYKQNQLLRAMRKKALAELRRKTELGESFDAATFIRDEIGEVEKKINKIVDDDTQQTLRLQYDLFKKAFNKATNRRSAKLNQEFLENIKELDEIEQLRDMLSYRRDNKDRFSKKFYGDEGGKNLDKLYDNLLSTTMKYLEGK